MKEILITVGLIFAISSFTSCDSQKSQTRSSRPTDDGIDVPGFLDSIERDVSISDESELTIGNTTLKIPKDSAVSDYRIRLTRLDASPTLSESESLVVGDAQSDIVEVDFYEPATGKTLASSDLLAPYQFKQTFKSASPTSKYGLMVINDKGTALEQRLLLPSSELSITHTTGLNLTTDAHVVVAVQLRVTTATLWIVAYAEEGLKTLTTGRAETLSSMGGSIVKSINIKSDLFSGAQLSINSDSVYATSSSVSLSLSATSAAEMYVTNSADCSSGGIWETFAATKNWTLSILNSITRVYAKFRAGDGTTSKCISDSITHDDIPPAPPTAVSEGSTSSSLVASPTISWIASTSDDVSHYQVAIGSTAGGSDKKDWTNVGQVTSSSIGGLSLSDNATYYAAVRAIDKAGLVSSVAYANGWTVNAASLNCPSNYVKIPANTELGTNEFCVMKYEAKISGNDDGRNGNAPYNTSMIAESRMSGTPWVYIDRDQSISRCQALGQGYDLISNAQWQAIARNIESVGSNWSKGFNTGNIDDGNNLNRGHADGSPNEPLAASNDGTPCFGTLNDNCTDGNHTDFLQKRTHTLSNGSVIWDIGSNILEWIKENNLSPQGGNVPVTFMTSPTYDLLKWGAAGNYTVKIVGERGGLGVSYLNYSDGAIVRGGIWTSGVSGGVFAANLNNPTTASLFYVGFRCTKVGGS